MNKSHALMHAFANGGGAAAAPVKKTKGKTTKASKTKAKPPVKKKNR